MRHVWVPLLLSLTLFGCGDRAPDVAADEPPGESPQALIERMRDALSRGDEAAMLALWDWTGVENLEQLRRAHVVRFRRCDGEPSAILPPADRPADFIRNGIRYRSNREIDGRIELQCAGDGGSARRSFSVAFGRKDGAYALTNVIAEQIDYDGPDDISLHVRVVGQSTPGGNRFDGSCRYTASGLGREFAIAGDANRSHAAWGASIDACEIRRVSGDGWIQLRISAGGVQLYESERTDLATPLIYRAPRHHSAAARAPR